MDMDNSDFSDRVSVTDETTTTTTSEALSPSRDTGWALDLGMTGVSSLSLHQNEIAVVETVTIKSPLSMTTPSLTLKVHTEPPKTIPRVIELDPLSGGHGVISPLNVELSAQAAWSQTSSERVDLIATLSTHGRTLAQSTRSLEVLAPDQWSGAATYPESIASFITPQATEIVEFRQVIAEELKQLQASDNSLDGYQSNNPEKIAALTQAAWRALARQGFTYAEGAHDHRKRGQTVITPADLLKARTGNCVDLTLLFCAALESIGLNPMIVLTKSHCFAAVWQNDSTFSDIVHDDPTRLINRINQSTIIALECTLLCQAASFQEAAEAGKNKVQSLDPGECTIIDVSACRSYGLRPLSSERQSLSNENSSGQGERLKPAKPWTPELITPVTGEESIDGRLQRWLTKLLDITLRNRLLAHRELKNVIPLSTIHIDKLEDSLAKPGSHVTIKPRPQALEGNTLLNDDAEPPFDARAAMSSLTPTALQQHAKKLSKDAKTILSETGTNAAYLALGMLNFTVENKSYQAPIILIPIEIEHKSAGDSVRFKRSAEDPSINHCLIEYLRTKHDIDIEGLGEELPLDDAGVDVPGILAHVEKIITEANRPGWHITRRSALGIFQFRKWKIWRDLRDNPELIRNSALCQMLLERDAGDHGQFETNKKLSLRKLACPLPFDSSQEEAITASASKKSFVLVGPPGTGKSQTITNILAKAIHDGRRVLFVAEKAVALAVVERHLETVGLSSWCLNLHSDHANRASFLASIKDGLAAADRDANKSRDGRLTTLTDQAQMLMDSSQGVRSDLHEPRSSMPRIWDVAEEESRLPHLDSCQPPELYGEITPIPWKLNKEKQVSYERSAHQVAPIPQHPLRDLDQMTSDLVEFSDLINSTSEACHQLKSKLNNQHDFQPQNISLINLADIAKVDRARESVIISQPKSLALLREPWAKLGSKFKDQSRILIEFGQMKSVIEDSFAADSIQSLQPQAMLSSLRQARVAWAPLRWLATYRHRKQLAQFYRTSVPGNLAGLIKDLEQMLAYEQAKPQGEKAFANLKKLYSKLSTNLEHDQLKRIRHDLHLLEEAAESLERLTAKDARLAETCLASTETGRTAAWSSEMDCLVGSIEKLQRMTSRVQLTDLNLTDLWIKIESLKQGADQARDWKQWQETCREIGQSDLGWAIKALESNEITPDLWIDGSRGGLMRSWLQNEGRNLTSSFSNQQQSDLTETLSEIRGRTGADTSIAVSQRYHKAKADKNNRRAVSQTNPLAELTSIKRSIRRVLRDCGPMLKTLKPCVLASPLAVAQHLEIDDDNRFDLVVFDEASQIPPWDALAALMRSDACIVVGDPKQLPPTTFFSGTTGGPDEADAIVEDENDLEDLESLLHECLGANLPTQNLLWHYRSADESLITLSNRLYYSKNPMHTLPSNPMPHLDYGVHFHHIPDGLYERGGRKVNEREAEFIVGEIIRRLRRPASETNSHSMLVVSFNGAQQNLIDTLLEAALAKDPEARKAYELQAKTPEAIDIKNLENVQGDERDIVLLSVCYGKYAPDRPVSMNFGPLNQAGGERRLNVAITRARKELHVVSSVKADDLDLSRTSQQGPRDIHRFLLYAEHGPSVLPLRDAGNDSMRDINHSDGIELQLAAALEEQGWIVETRYGQSEDWRIGLVIKRPEDHCWRLGIETDGDLWANYDVMDREAVRPAVLRHKMGWHIHRVALRDWITNRDQVLSELNRHATSIDLPEVPAEADAQAVEINADHLLGTPEITTSSPTRTGSAPDTPEAPAVHLDGYDMDAIIDLSSKGKSAKEISERMQRPLPHIERSMAELQAAGIL